MLHGNSAVPVRKRSVILLTQHEEDQYILEALEAWG